MIDTRRRRWRITTRQWESEFVKIAKESPDSRRVLDKWSLYGACPEAIMYLLYFYVNGPSVDIRRTLKPITDLGLQMKRLAADLEKIDRSAAGLVLRRRLSQLAEITGILPGRHEPLDESYSHLHRILLDLANIFQFSTLSRGLPLQWPDRKLLQSRALVMLYLHARSLSKSDYAAEMDIAHLLGTAHQAAKRDHDVDWNAVRQRIRRFRTEHPKEFAWLRQEFSEGIPPGSFPVVFALMAPVAKKSTERAQ